MTWSDVVESRPEVGSAVFFWLGKTRFDARPRLLYAGDPCRQQSIHTNIYKIDRAAAAAGGSHGACPFDAAEKDLRSMDRVGLLGMVSRK